MEPEERAQNGRLRLALSLVAMVFLVFFGLAFVITATGNAERLGTLSDLTTWGHGGDAYVLMISTIYIVWAFFLWKAPRDLAGNRGFIDFTIVANLAHFTLMLIASFVFPGEQAHVVGDVLGGYIVIVPLALLWLPVRRRLVAA